ncbi:Slam-dependent surface lipoprotein [Neisseria zoodegmatis]|uniref:HphA C-terminal domain-containing protein n=1 Tax=Neisseria zoodegmatis TaxID=326523 RepID=A0A1X3CNP2_9NEIS|nr:Slam-dependent surface lipoprotein [Neisseria zoodegmatis]OSI09178.1 hypothetical protein BWD10_10375 [Neisseria zoodegmatis]SNU78736.1 Uncharacterised protein [Neisseria zoodegmatis]SUA43926.1 Uncharacterised protein [Neisseria zoodegmatis]
MKLNLKKTAAVILAATLSAGAFADYHDYWTPDQSYYDNKVKEKAAKKAAKAAKKAAKARLPKPESEAVNKKLLKSAAYQSGIHYKALDHHRASVDRNGVKTIVAKNHYTGQDIGKFSFNSIRSGGASVQYGEWVGREFAKGSNRAVFYSGDSRTRNMPTYGTATYAVKGFNQYKGNNLMTGTLRADFGARTLAGSLKNSAVNMNVNTYIDTKDAEFEGYAYANGHVGKVEGNFFGNNASSLAGVAKFKTNHNLNTAFGGVKK